MRKQQLTWIFSIAISFALVFAGCTSDPCKDETCNDNGIPVVVGDICECNCDLGYEGERCEVESAEKFEGTYDVTDKCNTGDYFYTSTISKSSSNVINLVVNNFGGFNESITATLKDESSFEIDDTDSQGREFTGSGSLSANGNTITVNYQVTDASGVTDGCVATFTRQ